eukprot:6175295-Pleurochrysis_carterae.AAC.11
MIRSPIQGESDRPINQRRHALMKQGDSKLLDSSCNSEVQVHDVLSTDTVALQALMDNAQILNGRCSGYVCSAPGPSALMPLVSPPMSRIQPIDPTA